MRSLTNDRALVFGGSGFLGAHVLAAALARGADVVSVSRDPEGAPVRASCVPVDALESGGWERALDEMLPERVVLCAALSRAADCERDPGLAAALNAEAPERVAAWCADSGARLVHVSTDLVFGAEPAPRTGFDELHPIGPISEYGRSKAAGEVAVLGRHPGALVVRLPLLFGDSMGRGLGASDSLVAAVERGEQPVLFRDEWRTPLDVASAARALVELVYGAATGLLHVAGAERVDRHTLGIAALRTAGSPLESVRAGTRVEAGLDAVRPADVSLDSSRARALLPFELEGFGAALAGPRDPR